MTDAEVLEEYRLVRDALIADMKAGNTETEVTHRGKTSRWPATHASLEFVEKQIARYEKLASARSKGFARNTIQTRRP